MILNVTFDFRKTLFHRHVQKILPLPLALPIPSVSFCYPLHKSDCHLCCFEKRLVEDRRILGLIFVYGQKGLWSGFPLLMDLGNKNRPLFDKAMR